MHDSVCIHCLNDYRDKCRSTDFTMHVREMQLAHNILDFIKTGENEVIYCFWRVWKYDIKEKISGKLAPVLST